MPKIVVRKSYRCLPGRRRDLLAALQRVDAAAAEAGWPRGRYLLVETKAAGEPDLEVEFTFESYAEMEQLERRLREHLARLAREGRDGGISSAGQEFLLEPSATRYLLLLDEPPAAGAIHTRRATYTAQAPPPAERPLRGAPATPVPPQPARGAPATPPPLEAAPGIPAASVPPEPAPGAPATAVTPEPLPGASATAASPEMAPAETSEPAPSTATTTTPEPAEAPFEPEPELSPAERKRRQLGAARAALDQAERAVNVSPERRAAGRQLTRPERTEED